MRLHRFCLLLSVASAALMWKVRGIHVDGKILYFLSPADSGAFHLQNSINPMPQESFEVALGPLILFYYLASTWSLCKTVPYTANNILYSIVHRARRWKCINVVENEINIEIPIPPSWHLVKFARLGITQTMETLLFLGIHHHPHHQHWQVCSCVHICNGDETEFRHVIHSHWRQLPNFSSCWAWHYP